ncbi:hypothetical protein BJ546DRAFT_19041 [Cryomyces antarcticus]
MALATMAPPSSHAQQCQTLSATQPPPCPHTHTHVPRETQWDRASDARRDEQKPNAASPASLRVIYVLCRTVLLQHTISTLPRPARNGRRRRASPARLRSGARATARCSVWEGGLARGKANSRKRGRGADATQRKLRGGSGWVSTRLPAPAARDRHISHRPYRSPLSLTARAHSLSRSLGVEVQQECRDVLAAGGPAHCVVLAGQRAYVPGRVSRAQDNTAPHKRVLPYQSHRCRPARCTITSPAGRAQHRVSYDESQQQSAAPLGAPARRPRRRRWRPHAPAQHAGDSVSSAVRCGRSQSDAKHLARVQRALSSLLSFPFAREADTWPAASRARAPTIPVFCSTAGCVRGAGFVPASQGFGVGWIGSMEGVGEELSGQAQEGVSFLAVQRLSCMTQSSAPCEWVGRDFLLRAEMRCAREGKEDDVRAIVDAWLVARSRVLSILETGYWHIPADQEMLNRTFSRHLRMLY